jgi:hypothetical protein
MLIYILMVTSRMMSRITEKSKPISDSAILCLCLFITDFSALIFKLALFFIIEEEYLQDPEQKVGKMIREVNRMRYVIMSIEMLFICIPIKHNFVPHKLEL